MGSMSERIEGHDLVSYQEIKKPSFWARLGAHLVDSFVIETTAVVLILVILGASFWFRWTLGQELKFDAVWIQVLVVFFRVVLALAYFVIGTANYGTTVGKRLFRIYVVSFSTAQPISLGQSWGRCLGYMVSYLPFGGGFVMAAFHPEKRAMHDLIAGTVCIVKEKDPAMIHKEVT